MLSTSLINKSTRKIIEAMAGIRLVGALQTFPPASECVSDPGRKNFMLFSNSPQSNKLTIESKHLVGPKVQVTVDRTETDSGLDSLCDNGSPL